MPINYKIDSEKYEALSEVQKKFYHMDIPIILATCGVSSIKDESAAKMLVRRAKALRFYKEEQEVDYTPFISLTSNVPELSKAQFAKKLYRILVEYEV
jgi:hypothetical protein